jgi:hypothetical protein
VSKRAKGPPQDEYSSFKKLMEKIAKVPKAEADAKELEYQRDRAAALKKKRA